MFKVMNCLVDLKHLIKWDYDLIKVYQIKKEGTFW